MQIIDISNSVVHTNEPLLQIKQKSQDPLFVILMLSDFLNSLGSRKPKLNGPDLFINAQLAI